MRNVLHRAAAKFALAAFAMLAAVQAYADPIGIYESHTPAIAFDTANDRGLVVYENGGRIYGRFVNNTGAIAGSAFQILPTRLDGQERYKDPVAVFKAPQNRYYVAASQSYPSIYNLPEGQVTFNTADGIAVVALDTAGVRLAYRRLYTPGWLRNPLITDGETKPALAVNADNGATCCVAVAWQDVHQLSAFMFIQLGADLSLYDSAVRVVDTASAATANVAAAYDGLRNRFLFAYDGCAAAGRLCVTKVKSVQAGTGTVAASLNLPMVGDGVPGTPTIAYVPGSARYLIASATRTTSGASVSHNVSAQLVTPSTLTAYGTAFNLGYTGCAPFFCSYTARSRPHAMAIGTQARAMVVATSRSSFSGTDEYLAGFIVDTTTPRVIGYRAFSPVWPYIPIGRVVYSPVAGRAIATWEQNTIDAGVWTASAAL